MNYLLSLSLVVAMYYGNVSTGHGAKGRIGIKYNPVNHRIVHVYANTPAAEAGLRTGDTVLHVNAADIIGPAYTWINITVKRGDKIFTIEIERIPCEMVDEHFIMPENDWRKEIDQTVQPELT
jgi:C-terminal processing protease CtpA/Prc